MRDYKEIGNRIYQELSDFEKSKCSINDVEQILLLKIEMEDDYERTWMDKVHHVDLFYKQGFDAYVDINKVAEYISDELKKDNMSFEKELLLTIINLIRKHYEAKY